MVSIPDLAIGLLTKLSDALLDELIEVLHTLGCKAVVEILIPELSRIIPLPGFILKPIAKEIAKMLGC